MIIGCAIELAVGLLCVILGALIWKKQMLSLLHDYHYKNVQKENIPAYARLIGLGLICIGLGICASGLLNLLLSSLWWLPFLLGFAVGLIVMGKAQKKYNGSWMG